MNRNRAIFVHDAGYQGSAWDHWAERFTAFGFEVRAPTWPSLHPELAGRVERMVRDSDRPPVVIGHGVGGLIAQHLIGRGLGAAAVAIAPQPVPGVQVDTDNTMRGPLLLISGQEDRVVPDAVTRAAYKLYGDCTAVTNLKQFPDRGHSLIVDSGWHEVADYVLTWLAANGVSSAG